MHENVDLDPDALARLRPLGDAKVRAILDLFRQHIPDQINAAQAAYQRGDLGGVSRAAHSIKSSAGNLGARAIQSLAQSMEQIAAGAKDEDGGVRRLLEDLEIAWERLQPLLHLAVSNSPAKAP